MNKNRNVYIILSGIIVLILALGALLLYLEDRTVMNPTGTVGNTAGNLNNGGFFCEYDGKVYFSNSYDNGSLYSMSPEEDMPKKLNSVAIRNLLAGGQYLYYYRVGQGGDAGLGSVRSVRSFNRCDLDGDNILGLTRDTVVVGQLVDNHLYLLTAGEETPLFYKMKIDKSEPVILANYSVNPACAENSIIYYNGTQGDHYLYHLDTSTDISTEIWQGNLWYPVKSGDYIYYMDVENDYRLCRYSLSQDTVQVLTNDRVECFNVGGGYVYYQSGGDSPALKFMLTEGGDSFVLAQGIYTHINLTSKYVYFQEFGNDTTLYHAPLGGNGYSVFSAARDAVLQQ